MIRPGNDCPVRNSDRQIRETCYSTSTLYIIEAGLKYEEINIAVSCQIQCFSRNSLFNIFPEEFFGRVSTNSTDLGTL